MFCAQQLVVLPVLILGAYFFFARPRREWKSLALFAVPAGLLAYLFGIGASYLYFDPRPFVVGHFTPLIPHMPDNGFPSDHTLLAAALAAVGTYWDARLGAVLWFLAALIAAGRIYTGLHHPLDVIASVLIALIAAAAWRAAYNRYLCPSLNE